jgi:YHS domain-containing protein
MLSRRNFLISAAALPIATQAMAGSSPAAKPSVLTYDGAAIGGYDPVAYFLKSGPIKGDQEHAIEWDGSTWYFSTATNKADFKANPEVFAPKYGGYCAYAAALNYVAPTSADAWYIHEDRLYLNYSRHVRSIWQKDIEGYVAKADNNWPGPLQA